MVATSIDSDRRLLIPENLRFIASPSSAMTVTGDTTDFSCLPFSRTVLAPAGRINLPPSYVLNAPSDRHLIPGGWGNPDDPSLCWDGDPEGIFPQRIAYPEIALSRLEDAYFLPFAPPFLPESRRIANDFIIPWAPGVVGWFRHEKDDIYCLPFRIELPTARVVETAFYMGHSISGHFGHFIGDCLSRMHAWKLCRELFGDVKIIIEGTPEDTSFREHLLRAAGADIKDVVFTRDFIHCRTLLLATQSLRVTRYASPTSVRLWRDIRDAIVDPRASGPDKIYLSRVGQASRKMTNEHAVEDIFRGFGFEIIHPETITTQQQMAVVASARYIAGPGGSAMFNLAFQKHLRSILILTSPTFVQTTELLFLAGAGCSVYYHIGLRDRPAENPLTVGAPWQADLARLGADVRSWLTGKR